MARHLLQPGEQRGRIQVGPVAEQNHVVPVERERLGLERIDHERPVQPGLFLEGRVAVVPVGAALLHREAIVIGVPAVDAREAQAGHAVHVRRQQDPMPVDRGFVAMNRSGRQRIGHPQVDRGAFAPAQQGGRDGAVDRDRRTRAPGEVHWGFADGQVELGARQHTCLTGTGRKGPVGPRPQAKTGHGTTSSQALDEAPPGGTDRIAGIASGSIERHERLHTSIGSASSVGWR